MKGYRRTLQKITRQISRVLRVSVGHSESKMPIRIISTYAPHNGHTEETKRKHWEDVQELLSKTCKRHLIIWGADTNGQL